ncbi:MAG: DUF1622 domain-containing protein [Actinobacteria bacterium]|nr:DUF1622 domain-containing protein [Actinomycetota bacterium]MCB9413403.1 DUF1622 domain-containing protein [Actinomycetota bacterium]
MNYTHVMEVIATVFELLGVAILVVGAIWAGYRAFRDYSAKANVYSGIRRNFGRALLLGLEVLVAADIVKTVSIATTLENVLILGLLVLVRTLLSFSLDVEIDGILPWRRRQFESARNGT